MSTTTTPHLSDKQLEKLAAIIYERAGIHFPKTKKYVLESRLGHRLTELELDDYDQYIALLSMGPYQQDEFQEMFNRITINETSFFRNDRQLEVFESQVLPKVLEARASKKCIRIWSAACSSGEEPFTLAILLHRTLGVRLPDWRVEILGTDISEKVLNMATQGKYTDYALRATPDIIKNRYFKKDGNFYVLDPTIKSMVNFEVHNLKDRLAAKRHGTWDVIVCRNVMIYFDDAMKERVLGMFSDQLAEDGYLFIGHSESLRGLKTTFASLPIPQAFAYQKAATLARAA